MAEMRAQSVNDMNQLIETTDCDEGMKQIQKRIMEHLQYPRH